MLVKISIFQRGSENAIKSCRRLVPLPSGVGLVDKLSAVYGDRWRVFHAKDYGSSLITIGLMQQSGIERML